MQTQPAEVVMGADLSSPLLKLLILGWFKAGKGMHLKACSNLYNTSNF